MALGMRHWLGLVTSGVALVALWLLPPDGLEREPRITRTHEEVRARALQGELSRTYGVLLRRRWADSLSALAVRTEVRGLAVASPPPERLSPPLVDRWKSVLAAEAAELTPRDPDLVLGYFVQAREHGAMYGVEAWPREREAYVGVRDGRPYCLVVLPVPRATVDRHVLDLGERPGGQRASSDTFGPCRLYAQYGTAGPRIQAWLEAGAAAFATKKADRPDRDIRVAPLPIDAPVFGLNRAMFGRSGDHLAVDQCLAGAPAGCLRAVTDPEILVPERSFAYIIAHSPAVAAGNTEWRSVFGFFDDYLLADLEAEFGPEAFERFWTSDEEVPEAFEQAFGMEMGAWMATWVDAVIGTYPAGAPLTAGMVWGSLLTLLALAGVVTAVGYRRTVS